MKRPSLVPQCEYICQLQVLELLEERRPEQMCNVATEASNEIKTRRPVICLSREDRPTTMCFLEGQQKCRNTEN